VSELLVIACIINILELAKDQDMATVSLPAISIGDYFGYPLEDCAYTMLTTLIKWAAQENTGTVQAIKVCLDKDKESYLTFTQFYDALLK
jgi:O-acetyl-ADP-ribose deacetylase (regulator of RNase III)